MSVHNELYSWVLAVCFVWAAARLPASTKTCTAVTCVTISSQALWTVTFLPIDLKALSIIILKQKYTLLLVHVVVLFCNLNFSILNLY